MAALKGQARYKYKKRKKMIQGEKNPKWNLYMMNYNMKWLYNCHSDNHQNLIPHKPILMEDYEWLKQRDLNNHLILLWALFLWV